MMEVWQRPVESIRPVFHLLPAFYGHQAMGAELLSNGKEWEVQVRRDESRRWIAEFQSGLRHVTSGSSARLCRTLSASEPSCVGLRRSVRMTYNLSAGKP